MIIRCNNCMTRMVEDGLNGKNITQCIKCGRDDCLMDMPEEITREQFMDFFRRDDFLDNITPDDAHEIFLGVLHGSSDITPDLLKQLCNDYSAIGDWSDEDKLKFIKFVVCS